MKQLHLYTDRDLAIDEDMAAARWRKYLIRILTLATGAMLALYLWQQIPWSEILRIKHVQISGDFVHLSPAELETRAADIIRGGFITVSVASVKRELLQEAWIKEVSVRRVWPDSLMIFISEHEPVALWGSNGLISAEAAIFSPAPASFPAGLSFLNGPEGSEEAVLEKYRSMKTKLTQWDMALDMLALTERRAWQFRLENGPVVLLGRKDVESRFKRFFNFAIPYQADRLLQAELVDMRYTNGFAVKWAAESNVSG